LTFDFSPSDFVAFVWGQNTIAERREEKKRKSNHDNDSVSTVVRWLSATADLRIERRESVEKVVFGWSLISKSVRSKMGEINYVSCVFHELCESEVNTVYPLR
jgi:hypothetical protein